MITGCQVEYLVEAHLKDVHSSTTTAAARCWSLRWVLDVRMRASRWDNMVEEVDVCASCKVSRPTHKSQRGGERNRHPSRHPWTLEYCITQKGNHMREGVA